MIRFETWKYPVESWRISSSGYQQCLLDFLKKQQPAMTWSLALLLCCLKRISFSSPAWTYLTGAIQHEVFSFETVPRHSVYRHCPHLLYDNCYSELAVSMVKRVRRKNKQIWLKTLPWGGRKIHWKILREHGFAS